MPDQPTPPSQPSNDIQSTSGGGDTSPDDAAHFLRALQRRRGGDTSGGVNVGAEEVTVDGSIVGRDQITSTTIGDDLIQGNVTHVTNVGLSPQAVQRLLVTVGLVVFVTAACFFAGGIFVGAKVFTALNRPVNSTQAAADSFAQKMAAIAQLESGDTYQLRLTEDEFSSYLRFTLGPQIGLSEARVRALGSGQFVVYGRYADLGGLPVMLVGGPQTGSDQLFNLTQAAVQIVPVDSTQSETVSAIGWTPVPNALMQPLVDKALAPVRQRYTLTIVSMAKPSAPANGWTVINVRAK
jgi:hypothetical protein